MAPFLGERLGDAFANPAVASGHDCDFVFEKLLRHGKSFLLMVFELRVCLIRWIVMSGTALAAGRGELTRTYADRRLAPCRSLFSLLQSLSACAIEVLVVFGVEAFGVEMAIHRQPPGAGITKEKQRKDNAKDKQRREQILPFDLRQKPERNINPGDD